MEIGELVRVRAEELVALLGVSIYLAKPIICIRFTGEGAADVTKESAIRAKNCRLIVTSAKLVI